MGGAKMQPGTPKNAKLSKSLQSCNVWQVESQFLWQKQSMSADSRAAAAISGTIDDCSKSKGVCATSSTTLTPTSDYGLAVHPIEELDIRPRPSG